MKKQILGILLLLFCNFAMGQLVVNTSYTVNQMIQNFIGSGVTVTNATYTGGAASRGCFSNGNTTNLGLTSGVVLCTGYATAISNPASFFMSTNLGLAGDANLNNINNGTATYDASILEFDFVPISDTVKFRYVFGSEEYPNYICSQYNDVFAFFVTGPNPAGGNYTNYNIALIPGTTIPVSVNSVNSGTPGSGYTASGCMSLAYSADFINNAAIGGTTIAFGGFTKPFEAKCKVYPCQTYHLKMAVADGFNGLFDSGVFLEANSFTSNTFTVHNNFTDTVLGHDAIEGCSNGIVSFITSSPVSSPYTITYTVGGTATNGTDYTSIPTTVIIPSGQDSIGLIIHPLADGITEGTETVILSITNGCSITLDTINIIDNVTVSVNAGNNVGICPGGSATLTATPTGGIAPLTYIWSSGAGNGTPVTITPAGTTTYLVTVTDHCASTATDNVVVTVNPTPSVSATAIPPTVCSGQSSVLTGFGANSYVWMPGSTIGTTHNVTPVSTSTYSVTGTSTAGCTASSAVIVTVNNPPVVSATASPNAICIGQSSSLTASGANTYTWLPGSLTSTTVNVTPASTTIYTVNGTSLAGCTATATVSVTINPIPVVTATASPSSICTGQSSSLTASGANTYAWMPGSLTGTNINVSPTITTTYSVIGASVAGCTASNTVSIIVSDIPVITASASPVTICKGQTSDLTASGGTTYTWMPGSLSGTMVTVSPLSETIYTVTGSIAAGCSATSTVEVSVINIDISITSTVENCGHADGTATAIASGNCSGSYSYEWSTMPLTTTQTINNLSAGNYNITITCGGCSNTASVSVVNYQGPDANFIANPQITTINNSQVNFADITTGTIYSWSWDLGDGFTSTIASFIHSYGQVGTYEVTMVVTNEHGCTDSVTKTIIVNDISTLFIPNTFTPNGDGKNDVFTPYGMNIDADHFEMMIFNRWGSLVYDTKKWLGTHCEGWNGTLNNDGNLDNAITGVFVYKIYAGNSDEGYKTYYGEVTLIQ